MKFAELENIWTSDLSGLSNTDKGRVYFERAKLVVAAALADPKERAQAVLGKRFARYYLVKKIGCQPAVAQQNPKIRKLLADTDATLNREAVAGSSTVLAVCGKRSATACFATQPRKCRCPGHKHARQQLCHNLP